MSYLNLISFIGLFGLCWIAWIFSERRKIIPWRIIVWGIGLQLVLGFLVFWFPPTKFFLEVFSSLLNSLFLATDTAAQFLFGPDFVPTTARPAKVVLRGLFVFRILPSVVFFSGLMALLYNIGVIQPVINFFAKVFYATMRLSGAEALSGAANIFVGIEAAIVIKPVLPKATRSEICAILACCFGTAATSTLAGYAGLMKDAFPNIGAHLVAASVIAIPACFIMAKLLVPETEEPITAGGIPQEEFKEAVEPEEVGLPQETVGGEPVERMSPLDSAILGALEGVKMVVAIAAVLLLIIGLVSLVNQLFAALAGLATLGLPAAIPPGGAAPAPVASNPVIEAIAPVLRPIGQLFTYVNLQNIAGVVFYLPTLLTGVPVSESWPASVIIGRRFLELAFASYQALGEAGVAGQLSDRTVVIVSYVLAGFANLASVGIFVGGTIALIPTRRKDITEMGWKALFAGTLATLMMGCLAGTFYNGDPSILGKKPGTPAPLTAPASPGASPGATSPGTTPSPIPAVSTPGASPESAPVSPNPTAPTSSISPTPLPTPTPTSP